MIIIKNDQNNCSGVRIINRIISLFVRFVNRRLDRMVICETKQPKTIDRYDRYLFNGKNDKK